MSAAWLTPAPVLTVDAELLVLSRRYCEDHFVDVAVDCGLCPPPTARVSLEALLRSHLPNVSRLPFW